MKKKKFIFETYSLDLSFPVLCIALLGREVKYGRDGAIL